MGLWRTVVVRKWFGGFSQLVGDNQFAVLGLVLLGCLGRVCEVTGVTEQMVEDGEDIGVELRGFAEVKEVDELLGGIEGDDVGVPIERDGNDDLGEAIRREDRDALVEDEDSISVRAEESIPILQAKVKPKKRKPQESPGIETPPKKAKTKKAKKKRDTIDDLFSGLL